ncbi:MAG: class I SAM-dependent methyltransferase [Turneriella sp.]|nr:class I SAM-dependent methyltransferase [Turneriella sp.]
MPESPIDHVADTAFWVAYHRAKETARPDALFRDAFAEKLAGDRGRKIATTMPAAAMTNWVVVLRTMMIDRLIAEAIRAGVDTVVNLGAGLDARPFRMDLPTSLNWVEADFPAIIEYKEKILAADVPRCRLRFIKTDLADAAARQSFLREIDHSAKRTLVLTEGVIPYLSEENVGALAGDLSACKSMRYWITDYMTREAFERRKRTALTQKLKSAPMLFNPQDWFAFFAERGWGLAKMSYYADAAREHHRAMPLPLWPRLIVKLTMPFAPAHVREGFRRSAGFALLEKVS